MRKRQICSDTTERYALQRYSSKPDVSTYSGKCQLQNAAGKDNQITSIQSF